jgi:hypothetical protein
MSKTAFSDKCNIIGSLWIQWRDVDDDNWQDFFRFADLGCPMAYMSMSGLISINNDGMTFVDEAWQILCEMLDVDPDDKYEILDDLFSASPNEVLDVESPMNNIMNIEKHNISDLQ